MAPPVAQPHVQHQTSTHMMKTTRSGRPFVKDIHDLFSTLIVSLPMDTHRHLFRNYASTFTTEEAITNLGSLKFTQSNRYPDPKDPSRIVTTTTTTTFSMTKDMAKSVCQTFMDARLFENATDSSSKTFKDKSLYALTPKGTYVLEEFVSRNGITSHNLAQVFSNKSNPFQLYLLERSPDTDSLVLTRPAVEAIFRRFAGKQPNVISHRSQEKDDGSSDGTSGSLNERVDRNLGIEVKDRIQNQKRYRHTFYGLGILDWLCDFTTALAREEALKIANEFLRTRLLEVIPDKRSEKMDPDHQRVSRSLLYQLSELGQRISGWDFDTSCEKTGGDQSKNGLRGKLSYANIKPGENSRSKNGHIVTERVSSLDGEHPAKKIPQDRQQSSSNDKLRADNPADVTYPHRQESSAKKLSQILEETTLRSLFMEFLKANFCEENLLFLLDVTDFKAKYSAIGNLNEAGEPLDPNDQRLLVADAFKIYNDYLAPGSQHELNIDHALRQHLVQYMTSLVAVANEEPGAAPEHPITVRLYDKIEDTIFRLMATDSVPKFVKTDKYTSAVSGRRSTDGSAAARDAALVAQQHQQQQQKQKQQYNIEPIHVPSEPNHNHQNGSNGDTASIASTQSHKHMIDSNGDSSSIGSRDSVKFMKPSVATIVTPAGNGIVNTSEIINGEAL